MSAVLCLQGEDRAALSPTGVLSFIHSFVCSAAASHLLISVFHSVNQSASYPSSGGGTSCRSAGLRAESFLFRLNQREEKRKGESLFFFSSRFCDWKM